MARTDLLTSGTVHRMKSHPTLHRQAHSRAAELANSLQCAQDAYTQNTNWRPHLELINAQNY